MQLEALLFDATVAVTFALINRIRGGGILTFRPPIHPRFLVLLGVAALAYLCGAHSWFNHPLFFHVPKPLVDCALFALCWLAWCLPPWGNWITLNFAVYFNIYKGWEKLFVDTIDKLSFGNPYLALLIREAVCLVPVAVLFSPLYLALAPAMVACYRAGWFIRALFFPATDAIAIAELLSGAACWGAALILLP